MLDKATRALSDVIERGGHIASHLDPTHWAILAGVGLVFGLTLLKGNQIRTY